MNNDTASVTNALIYKRYFRQAHVMLWWDKQTGGSVESPACKVHHLAVVTYFITLAVLTVPSV